MKHEYCVPNNAGLGSTTKKVASGLGRLLDALDNEINAYRVERGELTEQLDTFKRDLIKRLQADGWTVTVPKNRYVVREAK